MNFKGFFWWLVPVKKIVLEPFWWAIVLIVVFSLPVLRVWWWALTPIILVFPTRKFYLWWMRWDVWYKDQKWVMLEVKPPREVLTPFKAMEDVFTTVWCVYDEPNWREIWCEGEFPLGAYWTSWEIASLEGEIHFYIRCLEEHRHLIESAIYSHYPEAEIGEVPDYTELVPKNMPTEYWTVYGEDYQMPKPHFYPIKTYPVFFEEKPEIKEEKRIDPITSLIEDMARLSPGEYFWLQIITAPITENEIDFVTPAKRQVNKIARRPMPKERTLPDSIVGVLSDLAYAIWDSISFLVHGKWTLPEDQERRIGAVSAGATETGEREMLLTPGEREVCTAIENKIKKTAFKTNIRGMYIATSDVVYKPHTRISRSYFPHFQTRNLNFIMFLGKTRTKVHYVWRGRRKYLRQRKILRNYLNRFPTFYPELTGPGNMILNSEELATIFHFPARLSAVIAPAVSKVEAKKGGPPGGLPTE